ncbi:MAG: dTDP-4-dehydrorhamnose 3,5-epimerase [Rhizobiaceae bacterium]
MEVKALRIGDVKLLIPDRHYDERGFFSETYRQDALAEVGIHLDFVQDNHSFSKHRSTVRGLHFQSPPFAQAKLVRVAHGAAYDVAVDIRRGSPTFGQWVAVTISADNWHQLLVPEGFAHAICTLEPNTEIIYKASNFYSPDHDTGILWNDPSLAIDWPVTAEEVVLSDRDRCQPLLEQFETPFVFDG